MEVLRGWAKLEQEVAGFEVGGDMVIVRFLIAVDSVAQEKPMSSRLMPNPAFALRYWRSC